MSILAPRLLGATVVDLFAGSGALGLEALSRGASHATFVERSRRAIRAIERNIQSLGAEGRATVVLGDALAHLRTLAPQSRDLGLADPPYGRGYAFELLRRYSRQPFARELWIEHDRREELPAGAWVEHRRYGDSILTAARAPAPHGDGPAVRGQTRAL